MSKFHAIEQLAAAGDEIQAIKELRAATGLGLREAKNAVEWFQAHQQWPESLQQEPPPAPDERPPLDDRLRPVEQHIAESRIIHAIKALRELTGWGLAETKNTVDHYRSCGTWPSSLAAVLGAAVGHPETTATPDPVSDHRAELERLMAQDMKIAAIKRLRELTGWGLRDAKVAVDEYQERGVWPATVLAVFADTAGVDAGVTPPEPPPVQPPAGSPAALAPKPSTAPVSRATSASRTSASSPLSASRSSASSPLSASRTSSATSSPLTSSRAVASAPPRASTPVASSDDSMPDRGAVLAALAQHLGHAPTVRLAVAAQRMPYDGTLVMIEDRACFVREDRGRWIVEPEIRYADVTSAEIQTGLGMDLHVTAGYVHERFGQMQKADADAALALFRVLGS